LHNPGVVTACLWSTKEALEAHEDCGRSHMERDTVGGESHCELVTRAFAVELLRGMRGVDGVSLPALGGSPGRYDEAAFVAEVDELADEGTLLVVDHVSRVVLRVLFRKRVVCRPGACRSRGGRSC
jgi:hypothetical protein